MLKAMVSVLSAAESEALIVRAVLQENHVPAQVVGTVELPSVYRFLGYEVLVPEKFEAEARRLIAEASAAGAAAADEAEASSEN